MAFKMKGWGGYQSSPLKQCFPGRNCKPGGRRTNKWRHKWNKFKANISDFFTKDKPAYIGEIETPDWVSPNPGSDRHKPPKQSLVNYTSNAFVDTGPPTERCKDCLGEPDYERLARVNEGGIPNPTKIKTK